MEEITKKELENLYYSKLNKEVCEILGVSNVTMLKMIRDAGIPYKGMGNKYGNPKYRVIEK